MRYTPDSLSIKSMWKYIACWETMEEFCKIYTTKEVVDWGTAAYNKTEYKIYNVITGGQALQEVFEDRQNICWVLKHNIVELKSTKTGEVISLLIRDAERDKRLSLPALRLTIIKELQILAKVRTGERKEVFLSTDNTFIIAGEDEYTLISFRDNKGKKVDVCSGFLAENII